MYNIFLKEVVDDPVPLIDLNTYMYMYIQCIVHVHVLCNAAAHPESTLSLMS